MGYIGLGLYLVLVSTFRPSLIPHLLITRQIHKMLSWRLKLRLNAESDSCIQVSVTGSRLAQ